MLDGRTTTHWIRDKWDMSQSEFANLFHIPISIVRNWDYRETMPEYIGYMTDLYMMTRKELLKYLPDAGGLPFPETYNPDVIVDGIPLDDYTAARDLYHDPWQDPFDEDT